MIIKIDPLDTIFFRDGKPFTMGDDTWADGMFPPYPSIIYGALRSTYFSYHLEELVKANEDNDPTRNLKINGIYLLTEDDVYLPLPNDCVQKKDGEKDLVSILSIHELNTVKSSCPTQYVLKSIEEVENIDGGLININSLKEYLECTKNSFSSILKLVDRVLYEPKVSIGINKKTSTAEEGKIYRADMRRLENKEGKSLSLIIEFEGLDLPERGMMKLGGEGKAVSYQQFESINLSFDNSRSDEKRLKLYLSTPAIFKNGWLPEWINEKTLSGKYKGLKLKLLTASIGKPIHIGGFDMKTRMPKAMRKAVPAGSVYYFEVKEGDFQKAFEIFNQTAISDFNPEQGFGISYVGYVKNA